MEFAAVVIALAMSLAVFDASEAAVSIALATASAVFVAFEAAL